jgi:hypothetical protein
MAMMATTVGNSTNGKPLHVRNLLFGKTSQET